MLRSMILVLAASAAQLLAVRWAVADTVHKVQIYQHPQIKPLISGGDADKILANMGAALQASSPACSVSFTRDGDPNYFDDGFGRYSPGIYTDTEFEAYKDFAPGALKIVREINACGGAHGLSIGGCSSIAGPIWLVTLEHADEITPIVWLHEYSHTASNIHRDDAAALMQPYVVAGNVNVNAVECSNIEAGTVQGDGLPSPVLLSPVVHAQTDQLTIQQFVERTWLEGVPFAVATKFTDNDVPYLEEVLKDRARTKLWGNAVAVLGAIGTIRAKYVLMNFLLSDPRAALTPVEYKAKASVPVALGWLIQRSNESGQVDRNALDTLLKMTHHKWWEKVAKIDWQTSIFSDQKALIGDLIVKAAIGLSLSGDEAATYRLLQLSKNTSTSPEIISKFKEDGSAVERSLGFSARQEAQQVSPETADAVRLHKGFLAELLKEHQEVITKGLRSFYGSKE